MYSSLASLELSVCNAIANEKLDLALTLIINFVSEIVSDQRATGNAFSSYILDKLCQRIGAETLKTEKNSEFQEHCLEKKNVVYIATEFGSIGGHAGVLEDFIKAQPQKEHLILITNTLHTANREVIEKRFASLRVDIKFAPEASSLNKLKWLQKELKEKHTEQVFLFNHWQDAVAIAAVQPSLVPQLLFCHHADHQLCLGVHLTHAKHIDISPQGFYNCRNHLEIKNNVYLPLVVDDLAKDFPQASFLLNGKLRTCSSGRGSKFEQPYLYAYTEEVPKLIEITGGVHIHIGDLSSKAITTINQGMKERQIAPERFIHIPWVKSLWQTLKEYRVDVYLESFPLGGGRASIEVMGSGTPIVIHQNYKNRFFTSFDIVYSNAFSWGKPDELYSYLQTLTPRILLEQAICARKHYESYHLPELLRQGIEKISREEEGILPPPLKTYYRDDLQAFIDTANCRGASIFKEFAEVIDSIYPILDPAKFYFDQYRVTKFLDWLSTRSLQLQQTNTGLQQSPSHLQLSQTKVQQEPSVNDLPDVRLIAFYLPQYHPIPENDEWWGKGFTEWTNVTKAKANFEGHYQPHLPGDLGFYDLRVSETRIEQAKLAKEYGISGFCYYYYWFGGKRLLNRPLDDLLASKEPDFPFCVCWANENWTRRWDGREHEVLISQNHSLEDDKNFIHSLIPAFCDDRYIRVNGKPLLMVYRLGLLPNPAQTAQVWREECRRSGIEDIYLCAVQSFDNCDPRVYGFDAAVEFPPVGIDKKEVSHKVRITTPNFQGCIWDYEQVIASSVNKPETDYKLFKTVMPSWDNTPRRQERAHTFINSTPENYEFWLTQVIEKTKQRHEGDERLVFINAWNEWGEGCHLEPDQKYGHQFLKATKNALLSPKLERIISANLQTISVEYPNITPVSKVSNRPKWSVMIPTYNPNPEYLEKTLRSVLEQDLGVDQMQIEVVDDRSTQNDPEELVRKIGQGRVSFYRHPKNLGLTGNWNTCIDRARGHWVHILHQDDLIMPGFYSRLQEVTQKEPTVGAVFCRHIIIDENDHWQFFGALERDTPGILSGFLEHRLAIFNPLRTPGIIVKRSVYEQLGGFLPELIYTLDWEMWKRIVAHYPVWYEPQPLVCYRDHSSSETSRLKRSGADVVDIHKAITISEDYLPQTIAAELSNQAREFTALDALNTANRLLYSGDIAAAVAQIREGLKCSSSSKVMEALASLLTQSQLLLNLVASAFSSTELDRFFPSICEESEMESQVELELREINLIIFPDWKHSEELLCQDLASVFKNLMLDPDKNKIKLWVQNNDISDEDANLIISAVFLNLVMEEDLDITEELEISLVGNLSDRGWNSLLKQMQARAVLNNENKQSIFEVGAENLPKYDWRKIHLAPQI